MQKLTDALTVIKEECATHEYCNGCPLGNEAIKVCFVANGDVDPIDWDIDVLLNKLENNNDC